MKRIPTIFAIVLAASVAFAQEPAAKTRATVEGIVTKDPDSQPVKKAVIELIAENQAVAGNYTAVTGPDGAFRIENILPGRYHLFAEHVGLLDSDRHRATRTDGRILSLSAGQEVKDLHVRLQAAAVIRGRVTDEDGDPLANAEVTVIRQTFSAGHTHWEQAGAERTNDLGEYRVANLVAGNVYVSCSPPPDFKSLVESGGAGAETRSSHDKSTSTYQTTYYPGTPDRSQASPIQLHAGDEFPINFSLTPSPSLSIRGSVVNLPPRTSATIMLQSRDFNLVLNGGEMHKDGTFIIHDVSPGSYTITAMVDGSATPMLARQALQVGSTNVDGVRLAPQVGATIRGQLRLEGKGGVKFDPQQIFLLLASVEGDDDSGSVSLRETFSNLAHVAPDGHFQWTDVPAGNYYVQVVGDPNQDWYVKLASAGGRDVNDSGISVNGGTAALDLIISANGGIADGLVLDSNNQPVPDAIVVAVPEPRLRGRADHYRKTVSDQSGHFSLHSIRPGDYTLFAWESVEGEAYCNTDFLKTYEGQGSALHVSEGEHKSVQLTVIADSDEQQ
jgi:protocatechuate 3,4-dioxygenase beta subunit